MNHAGSPAETIDLRGARRLALARAGLLRPARDGLPCAASGRGARARNAALRVVRRFGYLQLDTIPIAGARSQAIVLASRLDGFDPLLTETLLRPGTPLFEYWGHEASWLPIELYPLFDFRRRAFRVHPWYGDLLGRHAERAQALLQHIEAHGPVQASDLETGAVRGGVWQTSETKRLLGALWSSGALAIAERRQFRRWYDLTERVIPECWRAHPVSRDEAIPALLERALAGHGWATTGTLARTWRLTNMRAEIDRALARLEAAGKVVPCRLLESDGRSTAGWIRPVDLDQVDRLRRARPRRDRGVLLSPFDPVLWDRPRTLQLFGFELVLEIYKPAAQRRYGYYCLPVLAGDRLVSRVDLKADHRAGLLHVLARHDESQADGDSAVSSAVASALQRWADSLRLCLHPPDGLG